MKHAKLMRGNGIVPQAKFYLNQTQYAPYRCSQKNIALI